MEEEEEPAFFSEFTAPSDYVQGLARDIQQNAARMEEEEEQQEGEEQEEEQQPPLLTPFEQAQLLSGIRPQQVGTFEPNASNAAALLVQNEVRFALDNALQQVDVLGARLAAQEAERVRLLREVQELEAQLSQEFYADPNDPVVQAIARATLEGAIGATERVVRTQAEYQALQDRVSQLEAQLETAIAERDAERVRANSNETLLRQVQQQLLDANARLAPELGVLRASLRGLIGTPLNRSRTIMADTVAAQAWHAFGLMALWGIVPGNVNATTIDEQAPYYSLTVTDYDRLIDALTRDAMQVVSADASTIPELIATGERSMAVLEGTLQTLQPGTPLYNQYTATIAQIRSIIDERTIELNALRLPEIAQLIQRQYLTTLLSSFNFMRAASVYDTEDNTYAVEARAVMPPDIAALPLDTPASSRTLARFYMPAALSVIPPLTGQQQQQQSATLYGQSAVTVPSNPLNVFRSWVVAHVMRVLWLRVLLNINNESTTDQQRLAILYLLLRGDQNRIYRGPLTTPEGRPAPEFERALETAFVQLLNAPGPDNFEWAIAAGAQPGTAAGIATATLALTRAAAAAASGTTPPQRPTVTFADVLDSLAPDARNTVEGIINAQVRQLCGLLDTDSSLLAGLPADLAQFCRGVPLDSNSVLERLAEVFRQITLPPWNESRVPRDRTLLRPIATPSGQKPF